MPLAAIGLLFLAAILHTLWNFILKQSPDKFIMSWGTTVIGGILVLPVFLFTGLPPQVMWPYVLASAIAEAAYFMMLSLAYQSSDFSLVYPLARGTAPAFLAIWSILFLKETPSPAGLTGLGMIVLGLVIIGGSGLVNGGIKSHALKGIWPALATALLISTYTAIDGAAVKLGPSLPYGISIFALVPLMVTPLVLPRYGWAKLSGAWRANKWRMLLISLPGMAAYILVLAAYKISPVGYAGAIREMSVVLGALAGWMFLGERFGALRVLGALVMFGGILIIAIFG